MGHPLIPFGGVSFMNEGFTAIIKFTPDLDS
jgi:hypothetical protein